MRKQSDLSRTAESIGEGLGKLQARYDAWIAERGILATELQNYMSVAQHMLDTLGHTADLVIESFPVGHLAERQAEAAGQIVATVERSGDTTGTVTVTCETPMCSDRSLTRHSPARCRMSDTAST
jgi:hypothetical protein